jgi:hypothetical protein
MPFKRPLAVEMGARRVAPGHLEQILGSLCGLDACSHHADAFRQLHDVGDAHHLPCPRLVHHLRLAARIGRRRRLALPLELRGLPGHQAVHGGQVGIDRVAVATGLGVFPDTAEPFQVLVQGCRRIGDGLLLRLSWWKCLGLKSYEAVGDAKTAMRGAARVYRGEYRTRYIYHAQMEPVNATAAVSPDGKSVEIWAGTQGPTSLHDQVARLIGTERTNITLHQHFLGGGYGRRSQHEVILDALRLAKTVGKPVKLIWTREDDLTGGKFRPMTAHHIEAGFDAGGKLVAWHHRVVAESVAAYTSGAADPTAPRTDRVVMKGSPIPQYPIPAAPAFAAAPRKARAGTQSDRDPGPWLFHSRMLSAAKAL